MVILYLWMMGIWQFFFKEILFVEKNDYGSSLKRAIVADWVKQCHAFLCTILHSEHLDPVIVSVNNEDVIVSSDSNTIGIIELSQGHLSC